MQQGDVHRLLPDVLRRTAAKGTPLAALTEAMASLLEPADRRLIALDAWFDPYRAPDAMVPYLAAWMDLGWLPVRTEESGEGLSVEQLRALIAAAPRLSATRGTAAGLRRFLELALGEEDMNVVDNDPARPFHLRVEIPEQVASKRRLADLIVQFEKPAHLTHEVRVRQVS